jgi:hypothetical protein
MRGKKKKAEKEKKITEDNGEEQNKNGKGRNNTAILP